MTRVQTALIDLSKAGVPYRFDVSNASVAAVQMVNRITASGAVSVGVRRSIDGVTGLTLSSPVSLSAPGITGPISCSGFSSLILQVDTAAGVGQWEAFVLTRPVSN